MRFECPGCGEVTPDVVAEGGKPVYCTQCGRGYRFIYGFYHRYLYFVLNHPLLTYALLLVFALILSKSFPGGMKLLYLTFFTVFYWTVVRWVQRSHKYLEQLPTGPNAASVPAFTPPSPPAAGFPRPVSAVPRTPSPPPRRKSALRPGILVIGVFLLNLVLFPGALLFGAVSLTAIGDLLLDLIHGTGGGNELVRFLSGLNLDHFRAAVALYSLVVVFTSLFLLGINILAFSFVRARKGRGKELVLWSFVFWFLTTLLLGSQVVAGFHEIADWRRQEQEVQSGARGPYNLEIDARTQWKLLHAWRTRAEAANALAHYTRVLSGKQTFEKRHGWMIRGLAMELAVQVIKDQALAWDQVDEPRKASLLRHADEVCLLILKASRHDPDPAVRTCAVHSLRRVTNLPFKLPRCEHSVSDAILSPAESSQLQPMHLAALGSGEILLDESLGRLASDDADSRLSVERVGSVLRTFSSRDMRREIGLRLCRMYSATDRPEKRRKILEVSTYVETPSLIPIWIQGLKNGDDLRYRTLQGLYSVFRSTRLPEKLARVRRYYHRSSRQANRYNRSGFQATHLATAQDWLDFLKKHPGWANEGSKPVSR